MLGFETYDGHLSIAIPWSADTDSLGFIYYTYC